MLTPMDIQQKKFHIGLGYDKKDVNTFFEEVAVSFEELYRSNAELKEKVETLTDGLQNYKSKEAALQKSLMSAEKVSEDTKSKATKEAKNIELEAKNKAKVILSDAEARLEEIQNEIKVLETQYAAYKSNLCSLMKQQFEFLKENDFDADAYIDEKALTLLGGSVAPQAASQANSSFGSFNGDPQMRDESSLGGMSGNVSKDELTSTSAVYTSNLGEGEDFVDPFNPKKDNGRYNPFDGSQPETSKIKTSFTVNTSPGSKSRPRKTPKPATESAPTPSVDTPKTDFKATESEETKTNSIPTVNLGFNAEEKDQDMETHIDENKLVGDVEETIDGKALIGEDTSTSEDTDEFGFEFV